MDGFLGQRKFQSQTSVWMRLIVVPGCLVYAYLGYVVKSNPIQFVPSSASIYSSMQLPLRVRLTIISSKPHAYS